MSHICEHGNYVGDAEGCRLCSPDEQRDAPSSGWLDEALLSKQKAIEDLEARVAELEKEKRELLLSSERDSKGWQQEATMYARAWARELGAFDPTLKWYRKTHLVDELVVNTQLRRIEYQGMKEKLSRVQKLLVDVGTHAVSPTELWDLVK